MVAQKREHQHREDINSERLEDSKTVMQVYNFLGLASYTTSLCKDSQPMTKKNLTRSWNEKKNINSRPQRKTC